MKINRWKNSTKSISFIVLSMWPAGFLININLNKMSEKSGEISAGVGAGISLLLMLVAFAFAFCLRFFVAPNFSKSDQETQRNLQVYVSSFIIAAMMAIVSIYSGSWPIGIIICAIFILLGFAVKKKYKGSVWGIIILSAIGIFAERYFNGSSAWVWMYSFMYWTSLRYGLMTKMRDD